MRDSIETQLAKLRYNCGLQRLHVRNAFERRWARRARSDAENKRDCGPSDKYRDDLQAAEQIKRKADLETADKELEDFIAEHRPLMGDDWIGNDHGRLCWSPYLGGYPIDQHYCQREEGHAGNCADEWPEHRWACESPRGSWPQGVTGNHDWQKLIDAEKAGRAAAAEGEPEKPCEQSGANSENVRLTDGGEAQ